MATKVVRECDRLGCAIDSKPFSPGEALPSFETTGYTVLRTVTTKEGVTTTDIVADFDEVCGSCASDIEDLILRIKGEKTTRKPRKAAAEAAAPKRRGRPLKVQEAAPEPEPIPEPVPETEADIEVVVAEEAPPKRKRGRPKGSKNKPKAPPVEAAAEPEPAVEAPSEGGGELPTDIAAQLKEKVDAAVARNVTSDIDAAVAKGVEVFQKGRAAAAEAAEPEEAAGVDEPPVEADVETFETSTGDIVNAETGDVIATREEGEEKDEEVVASSNGIESAHPF